MIQQIFWGCSPPANMCPTPSRGVVPRPAPSPSPTQRHPSAWKQGAGPSCHPGHGWGMGSAESTIPPPPAPVLRQCPVSPRSPQLWATRADSISAPRRRYKSARRQA